MSPISQSVNLSSTLRVLQEGEIGEELIASSNSEFSAYITNALNHHITPDAELDNLPLYLSLPMANVYVRAVLLMLE